MFNVFGDELLVLALSLQRMEMWNPWIVAFSSCLQVYYECQMYLTHGLCICDSCLLVGKRCNLIFVYVDFLLSLSSKSCVHLSSEEEKGPAITMLIRGRASAIGVGSADPIYF